MFSRKQVLEKMKEAGIEIDAPALAYYLKIGIVKADVADVAVGEGQGMVRYHSAFNLVDIAFARALEDYGLRLAAVKTIMDDLREEIRQQAKRGTAGYARLQLIVQNPNGGEKQKASLQKCYSEEAQRRRGTKNPYPPELVRLNMDHAGAYLVVDVTDLLKKFSALIQ